MSQRSLFLSMENTIYDLANGITVSSVRCHGEPSEVHEGTTDVLLLCP
jgi:hypothetical protein